MKRKQRKLKLKRAQEHTREQRFFVTKAPPKAKQPKKPKDS